MNILHPRREEARGWLAGTPDVSRAATPRENGGTIPIGRTRHSAPKDRDPSSSSQNTAEQGTS
eukprot:2651001-Pyramimonas_sp.AAC.1